jgi:hypothetical protein
MSQKIAMEVRGDHGGESHRSSPALYLSTSPPVASLISREMPFRADLAPVAPYIAQSSMSRLAVTGGASLFYCKIRHAITGLSAKSKTIRGEGKS